MPERRDLDILSPLLVSSLTYDFEIIRRVVFTVMMMPLPALQFWWNLLDARVRNVDCVLFSQAKGLDSLEQTSFSITRIHAILDTSTCWLSST